ncbi:MAG: NADH peroxidase, partial [Clostridia bacterium]|nr:NADH peroxidase [Clostridia bacterium]
MKKWRCTVCGEIVESDVRPDKCPVCKVPGEKFVEIVEEAKADWATEHVIGVGKAAEVPEEIIMGLK